MSEDTETNYSAAEPEKTQESSQGPRGGLDLGSLSLIQIMDLIEDQTGKMDGALDDVKDEETRAELRQHFERVKGFTLLFQQKAVTEITQLDRGLKESRKREANWKDLAELFTEYKNKASEEMGSLKQMLESYREMKTELQERIQELRTENLALQEDNTVIKDALIRAKAIATRRANLTKLLSQLDDDERELWQLAEK